MNPHAKPNSNRNWRSKSPRQIPRWMVIALILGLLYAVAQPIVNQRFGWHWPSLSSLLPSAVEPARQPQDDPSGSGPAHASGQDASDPPGPAAPSSTGSRGTGSRGTGSREAGSRGTVGGQMESDERVVPGGGADPAVDPAADLLHGLLKPLGREQYLSPAGLRYTRGSEEGHRLKHLARHLEDQPERPGKHGVFEGSMAEFLQVIDDGYRRAQAGERGTRRRDESGRVVWEIDFSDRIGFVGGREGGRQGRPPARRLRLVVDQDRVITAFPF